MNDAGGLRLNYPVCSSPCLANSEMLKVSKSQLGHLFLEHQEDIIVLINEYTCLLGDVPTHTTVLEDDINVQNAKPIKQHAH